MNRPKHLTWLNTNQKPLSFIPPVLPHTEIPEIFQNLSVWSGIFEVDCKLHFDELSIYPNMTFNFHSLKHPCFTFSHIRIAPRIHFSTVRCTYTIWCLSNTLCSAQFYSYIIFLVEEPSFSLKIMKTINKGNEKGAHW